MPNRKVHVVTSSAVGVLYAAYKAKQQPEPFQFIEALGGLIGGAAGGRLPDVIEPATSPRHRGVAHSLVASGSILALTDQQIDKWQHAVRQSADDFEARAAAAVHGSLDQFFLRLAALLCQLFAGFLAGLVSGYLTHVALDFRSPMCVPLICAGC